MKVLRSLQKAQVSFFPHASSAGGVRGASPTTCPRRFTADSPSYNSHHGSVIYIMIFHMLACDLLVAVDAGEERPPLLDPVPEPFVIYNEGGDPRDGLRVAYYFEFSDEYPPRNQSYVAALMPAAVNIVRRSVRVAPLSLPLLHGLPDEARCHLFTVVLVCHLYITISLGWLDVASDEL